MERGRARLPRRQGSMKARDQEAADRVREPLRETEDLEDGNEADEDERDAHHRRSGGVPRDAGESQETPSARPRAARAGGAAVGGAFGSGRFRIAAEIVIVLTPRPIRPRPPGSGGRPGRRRARLRGVTELDVQALAGRGVERLRRGEHHQEGDRRPEQGAGESSGEIVGGALERVNVWTRWPYLVPMARWIPARRAARWRASRRRRR